MNLFKLISDIESVDPEIYERLDPRRRVFKHLSTAGKTLAAAALPGMLGSVFNKAYGQSGALPADIAGILNFALKLEYLEYFFYDKALNEPGLSATLTGAGRTAIQTIRTDELNHVNALRGVLGSQAIAPLTAAGFDFTGSKGGTRAPLFADVFLNYQTFLTVAQAFEDTGVRAYKGGAAGLMANKTVLEAALNIHSVEARHASHLRTMRRGGPPSATNNTLTPKSWISLGETIPAAAAAIYGPGTPAEAFPAESNVSQAGVNLQSALNQSAAAVAEAFDEPLDAGTVTAIALNFVVGNSF